MALAFRSRLVETHRKCRLNPHEVDGKVVVVLQRIKPIVERWPMGAALYRTLRDELKAQRAKPETASLGFKFAGHSAMIDGSFEADEIRFVSARLADCDVFVDVGANIGLYACLARKANRKVIAVEPMAANLRLLYANLIANGWTDTEVFPVGLADAPGLVNVFGGGTGASLVDGWAGASTSYRTTIPVSTLDIVLGERFLDQRLLIKIDVEGAEYALLQGARSTLRRSLRPTFVVEVCLAEHHPSQIHPNYLDVFELFWEHGYSVSTMAPERNVERGDVARWVENRRQDFGTHNFLFRAGQSA